MTGRHIDNNWRRSPFDARDHAFEFKPTGAARQRKVMPTPALGMPYDQGSQGSCTSNALARVFRSLHADPLTGASDFAPAREFIYDLERIVEHVALTNDSGAYGRDGAKVLHKTGVASEATFPYSLHDMKTKPPQAAYDEAAQHKISGYKHLYSLDAMLDAMAAGHCVVFGFDVPESFESDETANTGVLQLPKPGEKIVGGHEVFAGGYDMDAGVLICGNSWGNEWGKELQMTPAFKCRGWFLMPFEYVQSKKLSDDHLILMK